MEKFYEAQALLVSKYGKSVNTEAIMEEALELFLEKKSPKRRQEKRALGEKKDSAPKQNNQSNKGKGSVDSNAAPGTGTRTTQRVSGKVRDGILHRDGYRCTFIAADGTRCSETRFLEVDHRVPRCHGGANDECNLRCLCRVHNLLVAEQKLGREFLEGFY